jgi:regulator of protease activity HflC (stomatin/prohibitin superfamily)
MAILSQGRHHSTGRVTIFEYERGLFYRSGVFDRVLAPGSYRLWGWARQHLTVVDLRATSLQVSGQKVFTLDPLPVTVNLAVDYRIVDPVKAIHENQSYLTKLYEHAQREGRTVLAGASIKELMGHREGLNERLRLQLLACGPPLGLEVLAAEIKDLVLVASVRDLLTKEVEQKLRAQAALTAAREEVATLRAQANAARLIRDNPEILRLRELEAMTELSRHSGNTLILQAGSSSVDIPKAVRKDSSGSDSQSDQ